MTTRTSSGLRTLAAPFVVAPPSGTRTRTRLRVTPDEDVALRHIGTHLGGVYRQVLASRLSLGKADAQMVKEWRGESKRAATALSSSRWAGAITRTAHDQYALGVRATWDDVRALNAALRVLDARLAVEPGMRDGRVRGYRDAGERFQKSRRRAHLIQRRDAALERAQAARPRVVVGGGRLWRARHNLDAAGLTLDEWQERWDSTRMFLTADGETGKKCGNETIRVTPDGHVTIKVPTPLVAQYGTHLHLSAPVTFATYRGEAWHERVHANRAVRYDITYDPDRGRWYVDASWSLTPTPLPSLDVLREHRTLGVDLNHGFLTAWVVDPSGNPVGAHHTIALDTSGLPASTRDARLRDAITQLIRLAHAYGCASITIENLNFTDARTTGRETLGRGARGKTFRRTVAGLPTGKFRDRLAAMAATAGLAIIAVDPAYTSRWAREHWLRPLTPTSPSDDDPVSVHHAAAVVIGRRGLAHRARRHPTPPRTRQRTHAGQGVGLGRHDTRGSALASPVLGAHADRTRSGTGLRV